MKNKLVLAFLLALLLTGVLAFSFNHFSVMASSTIYIRADGSIDPPTAPISSLDNITYTFTGDISTSIELQRQNITIDGASYSLTGGGNYGFELWGDINNVTIQNVNIKNWDWAGIAISSSYDVTISGNNITNCGVGIDGTEVIINVLENRIEYNGDGIYVNTLIFSNVSGNSIRDNYDGIYIDYAEYCNFIGNNISDNYMGLYLNYYEYNKFYHNNFINNTIQTETHPPREGNSWDNSYPSGGNYWDNYTGTDIYRGLYQNETGSDGIGDTSYVVDPRNSDNYPLVNSWTLTETIIPIESENHTVTLVSNTTISQIATNASALSFESSGSPGSKGYVNAIFPMINTTAIEVLIDDNKLIPPPFPVINTNGTHYFIYFEFTLSTHSVTIYFASPTESVGGLSIPIDKLALLTPYIALTVVLVVITSLSAYAWKHWTEKPTIQRTGNVQTA